MNRRLLILVSVLVLVLSIAGASRAEVDKIGNLRVHFDAGIAPRALPRERLAPVSVRVRGSIATTDGSHPPALQSLELDLNRNGRISSRGLPTCTGPLLQSTSTAQAKDRCGSALVGHGSFRAVVALGSEVPAAGEILAFNSRRHGRPALLLHFFASVPVRFTLVVPLVIGHQEDGAFGTVLRARVPKIGGGRGSITEIDLTLGRRYSAGGESRSYASAACSAPAGFTLVPFPLVRAKLRFESHRPIQMVLSEICKVRGG
jgi:hypothetical protein